MFNQNPFGAPDPNSLPAMRGRAMPPGLTPGPIAPQQLTPGFRPPGAGGAPGMMPQQQTPNMGMDPNMLMGLMAMSRMRPSGNEADVNKTLSSSAPTPTQGMDANGQPYTISGGSDPMAQGAAQSADMQGGWLKRVFKGLF